VKLDPRSIPYRAAETAVQLGGLVIFAGILSTGDVGTGLSGLLALFVVGVVGSGAWQFIYHRRFDYELTAETVDIRSGVLSRREREIPYRRIQNVDVAQNAVQRLLGIAEVRLETAGGNETEASLQYVSRGTADWLQEELSDRKRVTGADTEQPSAGEELFRMGPRELVVLGAVSADLRLLAIVGVLASGVAPALVQALPPGIEFLLMLGPGIAVLALLGFWVVSGVRALFRYYDFRLTRHGDELRYERGLLQRYNGTIPLDKVQSVSIRANPLARQLGYATLVIETAGYAASSDATVQSAVPIGERERVVELATSVAPVEALDVERPPRRARTRYAIRYALVVVALTGLAWGVDAVTATLPQWYAVLALLFAVPPAAHLTWRHRGYCEGEDFVVTRAGFWQRRTAIVPYDRVQTVVSTQTVFQRRRNLASVIVDTAGGSGLVGGDAVAIDIDANVAERLRGDVADRLYRALATG
jgi:putative membrane protein